MKKEGNAIVPTLLEITICDFKCCQFFEFSI